MRLLAFGSNEKLKTNEYLNIINDSDSISIIFDIFLLTLILMIIPEYNLMVK